MATTSFTTRVTDPGPAAAPPPVVVVGNPEGRRVALLQEALAARAWAAARVVAYVDLLAGRAALDEVITEGAVLRIESPDRDFEVERALIATGADEADDDEPRATRIGRIEALRLDFDRGRILYPRQWYLGFCRLLRELDRQRASCLPHMVMNPPADIRVMFDKPTCHARFEAHGVPCPPGLGTPRGYDDLRERMVRAGTRRAFVKLAHGSSASGVVALETDGRRVQATTTVEAVDAAGERRLYNTRAVRRETNERRVAALIDALCRERAHAEHWIPKATLPGGAFDLRVVVIAGRPMHRVARVSRSPMTNLQLKNRRADPDLVRTRMTPENWEAVLLACERAAGVVPDSLYAGVDIVIASGFRRHAVLEINAFGDLLPGVAFEGLDAYGAELAELVGGDRT